MHWKFCVLELFHLSSVSQPLQVWSRDGSFPRSRKCIGPYSVRNEMSLTQNRQLHICENIQSGGFCWAPERRRLYFPHLISAIFEIFVLHDLNSTELPSLNEPPPEASDRAADLGAVKKRTLPSWRSARVRRPLSFWKGRRLKTSRTLPAAQPSVRTGGKVVAMRHEEGTIGHCGLAPEILHAGGRKVEGASAITAALMADKDCDLMQQAQGSSHSVWADSSRSSDCERMRLRNIAKNNVQVDEWILHLLSRLPIEYLAHQECHCCFYTRPSCQLTCGLRSVPVTEEEKKDRFKRFHQLCLRQTFDLRKFFQRRRVRINMMSSNSLVHKLQRIWTLLHCFIHFLWSPMTRFFFLLFVWFCFLTGALVWFLRTRCVHKKSVDIVFGKLLETFLTHSTLLH